MARKLITIEEHDAQRREIEQWIEGWAIEWQFHEALSVDSFDVERSLRNQARIGAPVDTETVSRYAAAMGNGDVFPAVVAWRDAKTTLLVLIDGNHRLMAAREAGVDVAVYVVKDAKPQTITAMTFEANVKHGKGTSEEERIHHALWLRDNGMTLPEAAKRMNVPKGRLTKAATDQDSGRRADSVGVNRRDWEGILPSVRNRLSNIHTDEGFREAVKLARDAMLSAPEASDLVARMNDTRSGTRQAALVKAIRRDEYTERIEEVKSGGVTTRPGARNRSPKAMLGSSVGFVNSMPEIPTIVESISIAERPEYAERVDRAIDKLTKLRKALAAE